MRNCKIAQMYGSLSEDGYYPSSDNGLESFEIDYICKQFDCLSVLATESILDESFELSYESIWSNIVGWIKRNWNKLSAKIKSLWNKIFGKKKELEKVNKEIKVQQSKPKTPQTEHKIEELNKSKDKIVTEQNQIQEQMVKEVKEVKTVEPAKQATPSSVPALPAPKPKAPSAAKTASKEVDQSTKTPTTSVASKVSNISGIRERLATAKQGLAAGEKNVIKYKKELIINRKILKKAEERCNKLDHKYKNLSMEQRRKIKEYKEARLHLAEARENNRNYTSQLDISERYVVQFKREIEELEKKLKS